MKQLVIATLLKLCAEVFLFTMAAVLVIVAIGYLKKWDNSTAYSNAFFVAACLMVIGGAFSRLSAGQEWGSFQLLHAESFREMSRGERASFIVDVSSNFRLVIVGLASGFLLMLIAWFLMKM